MRRSFPDQSEFKGDMRPTRLEADVFDLEVEGTIPDALAGTFYRVQPDPQFPPRVDNDIFFNGDGLVGAFRIANGHVDFKSRYVRTPKFNAERQARRALFGAYRNPYDVDPAAEGVSGTTSNTHVFVHGGKLLAMKEDGPPTAMDPSSLETVGPWRFDGKLTADTFTGHPKVDPVTGQLIAFGYEARGTGSDDIAYFEIDKSGRMTQERFVKAPHAAMIHDWGVTENFVVFPVMPLCSSVERMKAGLPRFHYRRDLDIHVGVMRRHGDGKDLKWFRLPNGFPAHSFNAFEDGQKVYLDMTIASDNVFPFFPGADGRVANMMELSVPITRICIDLAKNTIGTKVLNDPEIIMGDFPHCDDRYATRPYRYGFMASVDFTQPYDFDRLGPPEPQFFNGLGRLDMTTGKADKWWAGPVQTVQEPVFAPRTPDAPEGDGWVMAVVTHLLESHSYLVVLDTQHMSEGPVATARLPFRLRTCLHGNWVPDAALPTSSSTSLSS